MQRDTSKLNRWGYDEVAPLIAKRVGLVGRILSCEKYHKTQARSWDGLRQTVYRSPSEADALRITHLLDTQASIDWIGQRPDDSLVSFASRVQQRPDPPKVWPYETVTIRRRLTSGMPTEYDKIGDALIGDLTCMRPLYHVHTYMHWDTDDIGQLDMVVLAETRAVIAAAQQIPESRDQRAPGWNRFAAVPLESIAEHGRLAVWQNGEWS